MPFPINIQLIIKQLSKVLILRSIWKWDLHGRSRSSWYKTKRSSLSLTISSLPQTIQQNLEAFFFFLFHSLFVFLKFTWPYLIPDPTFRYIMFGQRKKVTGHGSSAVPRDRRAVTETCNNCKETIQRACYCFYII